jgi:hypothetical protein
MCGYCHYTLACPPCGVAAQTDQPATTTKERWIAVHD